MRHGFSEDLIGVSEREVAAAVERDRRRSDNAIKAME